MQYKRNQRSKAISVVTEQELLSIHSPPSSGTALQSRALPPARNTLVTVETHKSPVLKENPTTWTFKEKFSVVSLKVAESWLPCPPISLCHTDKMLVKNKKSKLKDSPVTLTTEVFSPRPLNCSQSLGDHGTRNNKMLFLEGPQGFT